ncbi:MAG: dienelactone hydrolase family protein [Candidatus Sulfotelmatobacter sp.]
MLLRFQDPKQSGIVARLSTYPVEEALTDVATPSGTIRARLYIPQGVARAPGIVIVHGVHHLGIEEPRLVRFARAMSASGIRVLTPELAALADYRIDSHSIALIGYSARSLSADVGQKVGVLGLSFAGGLSLLAASDSQFAPYIRFVVSVGAHDDLERVSEFLITNTIPRPDGTTLQMTAHEYGPLVLIYSHAEDFFPPADLKAARETLRLLLWEQVDDSRKQAEQLSPSSRQKMDLLYKHDADALAAEMKQAILRHHADMSPVSPHGRMEALRVPVFLLHGAADNVIPPSELLWLQRDVPSGVLKDALISRAISHVSMEGAPSFSDQFRLVHFMAQVLEMADDTRAADVKPLP